MPTLADWYLAQLGSMNTVPEPYRSCSNQHEFVEWRSQEEECWVCGQTVEETDVVSHFRDSVTPRKNPIIS